MIRVFHIISHFDQGGAERVAINIAKSKSVHFEYHVVEVVKTSGIFRNCLIKECREQGVHVHTAFVRNNKLGILFFPVWFTALFLKERPKIIHTHTEVPDMAVWLWHIVFGGVLNNVKYVRTIHNTRLWTGWGWIGKKVESFYRQKKANVAISLSTQENYQFYYGERPEIIYNGIEKNRQIQFPHIVKGKINILFAGRLEYQKGVSQLIEVMHALADVQRFYFHIVGEGSRSNDIDSVIKGLPNCRRYPKIYGLSAYLSSFDYLFMPSNFEGLALLPLEAGISHVPTIINRCKGLKECLPSDWPLSVENNDVGAFLDIFNSLPQFNRKLLGEQAYKHVSNVYSIKQMQTKYEKKYQKVLGHDLKVK